MYENSDCVVCILFFNDDRKRLGFAELNEFKKICIEKHRIPLRIEKIIEFPAKYYIERNMK